MKLTYVICYSQTQEIHYLYREYVSLVTNIIRIGDSTHPQKYWMLIPILWTKKMIETTSLVSSIS